MSNLIDKQKFKSSLMAQGITMSDDEIDSYLERVSVNEKPKSYLPHKQFMMNQERGAPGVSLETPYEPFPEIEENRALDFVGNLLWEAIDVGTFGAVGALDYKDYFENIITTGGPGTFAGRVGAGVGGLIGFMPPMGLVKGAANLAVKNLSTYGAKKAGQKIVSDASRIINNRSKYHRFSDAEKANIFKPWIHTLNKYGHRLENETVRKTFIEKVNKGIQTGLSQRLKDQGIRLNHKSIKSLENMIKSNMGTLERSHMPIWNLQQRIAIMLGGGQGAGKLANIASHVIEEAAIFAAVETPMEIMNSIDEFRDVDMPGTLAHAVSLGSALGLIRFIPGGKDQPIMRAAWGKVGKMFDKRRGYQARDYSDADARKQLSRSLVNIFNKGGKGNIFKGAFTNKDWDDLGTDAISSAAQILKLAETEKGAKILAKAMGQIERNWNQKWWPAFFRESAADLWGSTPRMVAGSMAFNYEILFDDNVPMEDKVFNILVGAYMTKRGRTLEFTNSKGVTEVWKPTKRPYVYSEDFKKVSEYLDILGMSPQDSLIESLIRESELTNKYFKIEDTADVKLVMDTLSDLNVIVPEGTPKKKKAQSSANKNEHAVYDYWKMLTDVYFLPNSGQRMLGVEELTRKQINKIENKLKTLNLTDTKTEGGIFTVSDIDDILLSANDKRTTQAVELYKDVIVEGYNMLGLGEEGILDRTKIHARLLGAENQTGSPEFIDAVNQLVASRDLLNKHGYIRVSKDVSKRMKIDMSPKNQEKFINLMKELDSRLHDIIYEGTPVWDEVAPRIGDEFVNNVIDHNSFYRGVRNSYEKLNGLDKDNLWRTNEITSVTDRKDIVSLIEKLFVGEINLYDKVVLDSIPRDHQKLQEFIDNLGLALTYTSKYRTPPGFVTTRKENTVNANDVRKLRNLFINNDLNGFAFTGRDSEIFMHTFLRHTLDRSLRSAVKVDGKPLTGADRAKLESLIDVGIVNPRFELIDINRTVNVLTQFMEKPEFLREVEKLKESGGIIILDESTLKKHFAESSIDFVKNDAEMKYLIQQQVNDLRALAKLNNVSLEDFVVDLHKQYNEYIKPYLRDGTGKGLLTISDVKAEADLLTMRELVTRLKLVEKDAIGKSHSALMETLDKLSNGGQTKEINDFINKLRNKFWDRSSEMPELLALLTKYGPKEEPLYDAENRKFNFNIDGAEAAMKKVMREMDLILPTTLRNNFIEQRMKELLNEKAYESDSHTNVTPESFKEKYNISLGKGKDLLTHILSNSTSPVKALKNKVTIKRKDDQNTSVSYKDFTSNEKIEFIDDVLLLTHGTMESRNVERLIVGQNAGVWLDKDNTVYNNPYFRFLDDIVANYYIVDKKVETANGLVDIRSEQGGQAAETILHKQLGMGGQALDSRLKADDLGVTLQSTNIKSQYFINVGDFGWGISIPKEKANDILTEFIKFVETNKGKYKGNKYKKVFKRLDEIIAEKVIENEAGEKLFNASIDMKDSEALETMLNTMWMDKMAGEIWWDHLSSTVGGRHAEAVAKFTKRFRLMANVSGKELSNDYVNKVYNVHKGQNVVDKDMLGALEILKDNKGLNIVIPKDEGDGKIMSELFSTLSSVKAQINKELKNNKNIKDRQDIVTDENTFRPSKNDTDVTSERGDASSVDSVMLMPLKYFKALQLLSGSMSRGNIGGIKPIVSKVGKGILLGKTVILPDTRFNKFFKMNDKVHAIMMDSANKIAGEGVKKLDLTGRTLDDFRTQSIGQGDYINKIAWRDINIASIVSSDHKASISYQAGNELGLELSGSMFKWLIEPSLKKYQNTTAELNNPYNTVSGTATAKAMDEPGTSSQKTLSMYNYWIRSNGPTQFKGIDQPFKNQVKRRLIDEGLLSLRNDHGSQSVMSPFIGGLGNTLRNTTFALTKDGLTRNVYTYGQAEIAGINRNKQVVLDRLNIIINHKNKRDEVISYKDLDKEVKEIYKIVKGVNFYEHKTKTDATGDKQDVWVVKNKQRAQAQVNQMKRSAQQRGEAFHFSTILVKDGVNKWKLIDQKRNKDGTRRGDDKLIYLESNAPMKELNKDPKGRVEGTTYKKGDFAEAVESVLGKGNTVLHDNIELHKVASILRKLSELKKVQHEVALVFHRPPRTRQGDMIVVGLKGFTKSELGNQARLNPFDAWARAEADYDVDKINYWWDTPNDILAKWNSNSGKAGIISPETPSRKTSLEARYDHLDARSMRQLNKDYHLSSKARGPVVKAQRIVQYFKEYSSRSDEKGFILNLFGMEKLLSEGVDQQRIKFDHENANRNLELLAEDIQRIVDSSTGYNSDLYNNKWFEKFLFGDGDRYQGIFKKEVLGGATGKEWVSVPSKEDVARFTELEKDIILETVKPYQGLLQLGTTLFENGEAKTPRYDDILTQSRYYDSNMRFINSRIYNRLKKKYIREGSTDNILKLNSIFGWNETTKKIENSAIGDFGLNASLGRVRSGDHHVNRNLSFEKTLAAIMYKDRLAQDGPKHMFGRDYGRFEQQFNDLVNSSIDADHMQKQISTNINNMKSDVKKIKFLKYLGWKLKNSENLYRNAMRDGHINFAESIKSNLDETRLLYKEVEKNISSDEKTINYVSKIAENRIRNEIIASPRMNKYKTFAGSNPRKEAIEWVKRNSKTIKGFVSKDLIKFKGIDSPEYRDVLIFSQILNKYKNVFIDSEISVGQDSVIFEQDIRAFKKNYKNTWSKFFKDKKRSEKFAPWLNESRVMNLMEAEFQTMFQKWEGKEKGLGKLFLWKIMAPDADIGTYTYFNGKIMEGFNNASLSFVKFGLRFFANSKEISEFEKTMFFDLMSTQYTDWYHTLHSIRMDKEGIHQRAQWDQTLEELYISSSPLLDYLGDYGGSTMQKEWNPGMHSVFGSDNSISYGYLKDLSSIPAMKAATNNQIFPRGYIPMNYRGGEHPHIVGWADFNKARRSEAYLMLGETLGKGVVMYRESPIIKRSYEDIDSKPETHNDIRNKINDKITDEKAEENAQNGC